MKQIILTLVLSVLPLSASAQSETGATEPATGETGAASQPAVEPGAESAPAEPPLPAPAPTPEIDIEALKAELKAELREELKHEVKRAAQEAALREQAESVWKEEAWIEEIKPELNFLEFDGYLRTRMDLFQGLHLGTYDPRAPVSAAEPEGDTRLRATSSVPPPTLYRHNADNTETLTSANMRLRLQPTLNVSEDISIHTTMDVFDNLVLGSTPESLPGFTGNPTLPLPAFSASQAPPESGYNTLTDSFVVKRVWAEVMTPFGQLRFGRVPSNFGLGLLANDGNDLDSDYGDNADRIMFITRLYGHYIVPAWDFTATGPAGRLGGDGNVRAKKNEGGQRYDLDPRDDVKSWILAVARRDKEADVEEQLANDGWVLNYGGYFVYRTQSYDQPEWYMNPILDYPPYSGDEPPFYVLRDANAFILSMWGMFQWHKLKLEAEAVGLYGTLGNMSTSGGIHDRDPYNDPVTIMQWGFALESSYAFLHDSLVVGFNGGMASGDDSPGWGLRPAAQGAANPDPGDFDGRQYGGCVGEFDADGNCTEYDTDITNYRFDADYHVDLILFREVLGTVTDAIYLKPHITYYITEGLGVRGAVIQSFSHYASSTPGNSNILGTEVDAHLFYESDDGFYAGIAYGILFPWQGMSHRQEVALSDEKFREAKFAQTVQGIFAVMF